MIDHERIMLVYLQLADVAHRKRQTLGRGRFLVLGGAAALRAGWPAVAVSTSPVATGRPPLAMATLRST